MNNLLQLVLEPEDCVTGHIDWHAHIFIREARRRLHLEVGHQTLLVQERISLEETILNFHGREVIILEIVGALKRLHSQRSQLWLRPDCAVFHQQCWWAFGR